MLQRISIRQFAIIESLDLEPGEGLTVLTGETGAGKSILVGALNLVLGGRATPELIRTGFDFAEVSAVFDLPDNNDVAKLLAEIGVESDGELLFRRQVKKTGRSRAWLNDRPVSVKTLGDLAELLVDIAGQHQHQSLMAVENHLLLLDRFGKLEPIRNKVTAKYNELLELIRKRDEFQKKVIQTAEREEFLKFQLKELENADIRFGEEDQLITERNLLRNAETINDSLSIVFQMLSSENASINFCSKAENSLEKISDKLPQVAELGARLQSARLELEDIGETVKALLYQAKSDPARLDEVESRLAKIKRLLQKHGPTTEDLIRKVEEMKDELAEMGSLDEILDDFKQRISQTADEAMKIAKDLSKKRKKVAKVLSKGIEQQLADLSMEKTRFEVRVANKSSLSDNDVAANGSALGANGIDDVEFMISPNQGETLKPMTKIASGGELSRVMLAIKSVLMERDPVETSIFDEVDAGIGGEVAKDVGLKIKQLAQKRQVICITHLPQIVVYGDNHYKVKKTSKNGRTYSDVVELGLLKEREEEVARMMTGESKTKASVNAARELITNARKTA